MLLETSLIDLGVAFLFVVALAEWSKVKKKSERGFGWLAAAGISFLFAGTINETVLSVFHGYLEPFGINAIFSTVGWLFAMIGTVFIWYETLMER